MKKRILISCFEVPGWGGASTSSYDLFSNMLEDGYEVSFLNLISADDKEFFHTLFNGTLGNPKHLPDVYNYYLSIPQYQYHSGLAELIKNLSPDVILAVGWISALLIKKAAQEKKLILLTTGSDQVKYYINQNYLDNFLFLEKYMKKNSYRLKILSKLENEAVINADLVITHSEMMQDIYRYFFRSMSGKILNETIWFSEWIYKEASKFNSMSLDFSERNIDLIFVASDWTRTEKNYEMVKKLIKFFSNLKICIVGKVVQKLKDVDYTGIITDREKLFKLLGNSKTIVSPSLFDSAPGILFEASALGCNIVTSKNCGNWQLCSEDLLVDPFKLKSFQNKISASLTKKYKDNIEFFLQTNSYKKLAETISLF